MTDNNTAAGLFQGFELKATIFNSRQLEDERDLANAPHLALVGRSNVGKSSLLNSLAGRKSLAKVSSSPGKTRSINFYQGRERGAGTVLLADLPGYGFARCSHSERESWRKLLDQYFNNATGIRGVLLLLDCRIPPQDSDKEMAAYALNRRLPLLPVLTKADKITQRERALKQREWQDIIGLTPMPVSSKSRLGLNSLCQKMLDLLGISLESVAPSPDAAPGTADTAAAAASPASTVVAPGIKGGAGSETDGEINKQSPAGTSEGSGVTSQSGSD